MEIKGKVHCFFEQSGTFKNEFIKLGIPAEDYDIQDNFGETSTSSRLTKKSVIQSPTPTWFNWKQKQSTKKEQDQQ